MYKVCIGGCQDTPQMEDRVGMGPGPQGSFTPHLRPGSKAREVSTWIICARKVRTQDVIGTVDRTVC